jgi:dolichol-phosphate mannosyltransferase
VKRVALVIAALDEEENIGPLTARIAAALDAYAPAQWELIYVIEGSDGTLAAAKRFAAERSNIRILYGERPCGLGRAFRTGFSAIPAECDAVITMDADLNHQPEEIPLLLEALDRSGAAIVIGSRKLARSTTTGMPGWKLLLSGAVNRFLKFATRMPARDMTSGFRAYRAEALRRIRFENAGFAFLPEMLIHAKRAGMKIVEEPIAFTYRVAGESKMGLIRTGVSYIRLLALESLRSRRNPGQ